MPTESRARRLRLTFRWACGWLALQGLLNLLLNQALAERLRLRYDINFLPYIRQAAVAQLALALLLSRAVQDPRRQALAVDVLLLALLLQVYLALSFRLGVDNLVPFEWLGLLANSGLAGMLILDRTRSGQMQDEFSVVSAPAMKWLQQLGQRATGKSKQPISLGSLSLPDDPSPAAPEAPTKSKAVPHMD